MQEKKMKNEADIEAMMQQLSELKRRILEKNNYITRDEIEFIPKDCSFIFDQGLPSVCATESFLSKGLFYHENVDLISLFTQLVPTKQHFEQRLF